LAGAAGALLAPVFAVSPTMGALPVVKAFIIIIVGGMGSLPGAVLGGLLLGAVEGIATLFMTSAAVNMLGFLIVIAILLVRPRGLLGAAYTGAVAGARLRSPRGGRRRRPGPHARLVLPRRRDDDADEPRADPQPAVRDEHGPAQHGTYLVHGYRCLRFGAPRDARGMVLLGVAGGGAARGGGRRGA